MQFIAGRSWLEYNFGGTRGRNLSLRCCGMLRGEFNRLKSHGVDGEAGKTESWGRVFCGSQGMTAASWCRLSIFRKFVIAKEGFRYIEMFWDIFWGFLRYIENYIYVYGYIEMQTNNPLNKWLSIQMSISNITKESKWLVSCAERFLMPDTLRWLTAFLWPHQAVWGCWFKAFASIDHMAAVMVVMPSSRHCTPVRAS